MDAFVEHHAADQLNVEVPLAKHALGGFAHHRESRDENIIQCLAGREFLAEGRGLRCQSRIVERGNFRLRAR